ncbi:transferase hexapeptide repeat family protein [Shewanella corallii]|uniref:Transferase hexapeptide repeat family protein n=1 Tax=Shewanella corallii TaxID=560080 RepID=A0ABT0N619_9GAMM|nr:transferase hexapeptide repeat family protein [Shewanella corallii]MCL2913282.1 transferase hexapeptide repeat family protein [Shewanella corallii]
MPIYAIEQHIPVVDPSSYIHPTATIIGDVVIGKHCYIGPNASLRGDFGSIKIGDYCNVQDNCVIHSFPEQACVLESHSHIGHAAVLHGCHIGHHALIGINCVVMDMATIGSESIVAASSFIKSRYNCPPRSLLIGSPAKLIRTVSDEEFAWKRQGTDEYIELTQRCLNSLREVSPLTEVETDRPTYSSVKGHAPKTPGSQ